eukprot:TRINITY_DN1311_c0_g1_i1.p1 TRINITY_DN1311_c0_g1~~TRINITY_DN1311_c0_g1_i1.p1  ORF type:complete len:275 (-),score=88.39 TRINITY_DN1311_c0_g1_i1:79-903(-)
MTSFTEQLDQAGLDYFESICQQPFSQQAVAFLNAYWQEVGEQAEFIFSVAYEKIKYAEMETQGIHYVHQYEEGNNLDYDIALYFYEIMCKYVEDAGTEFCGPEFARSHPVMMTALARKKELREKVDVNFDGRVSFLEYLLYQYRDVANPADFVHRSMEAADEHPEIRKARLALEDVNAAIAAYEAERLRLTQESELSGVRGLKAKNELAQLDSSPLWEQLNTSLIKAEAALRRVQKLFAGQSGSVSESGQVQLTDGSIWWMNRDLDEKKKRYGR